MKLFKFVSQSKNQANFLYDYFKLNNFDCIRLGSAVIVNLDDTSQSKQHLESFCYIGSCKLDLVTNYDKEKFLNKFENN